MINQAKVKEVAETIKLDLTDELVNECVEDLTKLAQEKAKLDEIDTENVKPTYYGNDLKNVYRPDKAVKNDNYQELLERAPLTRDGYVVVPTIIED